MKKIISYPSIKLYKKSFHNWKTILKTTLIDFLSFTGIIFLIYLFYYFFMQLGENLVQGKTAEELTQMLLSMPAEQLNSYLNNIKLLMVYIIFGTILLIVLSIVIYAYSRTRVWKVVANTPLWKKFKIKVVLKWLVLLIITLAVALIIGFIFLVLRFLILYLFLLATKSTILMELLGGLMTFGILIILLYLLFAIKLEFLKSSQVWKSVGDAFKLMGKNIKSLAKMFVFQFLTFVIINFLVTSLLEKIFPFNQFIIVVVQYLIIIFFLSWSRLYFYECVKEK